MSATVHLTKKRRQINPSSCICSVTPNSGLPSSWKLVRLNQVQWWSTEIISVLETVMCKGRLRFGFVQFGDYLMEECREDGGRLFLEVQNNRKRGSGHKLENGKFIWGKFHHVNSQISVVWGHRGISVFEDIQNVTRRRSSGHWRSLWTYVFLWSYNLYELMEISPAKTL